MREMVLAEPLDPRAEHDQARSATERWRSTQERSFGRIGAVAAVAAVLFLILLLLSMCSTGDHPNGHVGQTMERGAMPDTPRDAKSAK